ncbi:MAG: sulfite exporter TauE/SafE family protein [Phycisphaerales bacterium]
MTLDLVDTATLLLIGLTAGILGGLAGLGGSIIMIPAMAILFHGREFDNQHLFQAAAMAVNVCVSIPAALRHQRAGLIRADLFRGMLPATAVTIVLGVFFSNTIDAKLLERCFAAFIVVVALHTFWTAVARRPEPDAADARVTPPRSAAVGGVMGLFAGVLGVGGGIVAVPMARTLCRLPLKQCIAASAAVMGLTSAFGAAIKLLTLPDHGFTPWKGLLLAATLAPTAILGGYVGAGLTRALPILWVRLVLATLLLASSAKMVGLW